MNPVQFGNRWVGHNEPVVVVAEIGTNHEGDVESCLECIRQSARAGASAIKLQTSDPSEHYPPEHPSFSLFSSARLSQDATRKAFDLARSLGMEAFSTTGFNDLEWLLELEPAAMKVSSGLLTHTTLVHRLAQTGRTLILSTGMSEGPIIDDAVRVARDGGCANPIVLQCTSLYPAPENTVSLRTIEWLSERYGVPGGLSDHSTSEIIPAFAVAAGATLIEKHFSLTPERNGYDHQVSLGPEAFARMVQSIRLAEAARGTEEKLLNQQQKEVASRMLRRIITKSSISKGSYIQSEDLAIMRPHDGVEGAFPKDLALVIGRKAASDIPQWTTITFALLE